MSTNWPGAAGVAGYALLLLLAGKLGWQHLGLIIFFWACLAPQEGPRRFLRDWWPMVLFWLGYDAMRVFSVYLLPRVAVEEPYRWEAKILLAPDGVIWPFYFARWMARRGGELWPRLLSVYCTLTYVSHLFTVPVLLWIIWKRRETLLFRRLVWSLTVLHVLALSIYIAYPAAPPWWVYENGFVAPSIEHSVPAGLKRSTLAALFEMSPNRFAAIPSVHGAYPLLLTLVLSLHGVRLRWILLAGFYAASMWFASVFLNQHYIVDLLTGALLVPAALPVAARIKDRHEGAAAQRH